MPYQERQHGLCQKPHVVSPGQGQLREDACLRGFGEQTGCASWEAEFFQEALRYRVHGRGWIAFHLLELICWQGPQQELAAYRMHQRDRQRERVFILGRPEGRRPSYPACPDACEASQPPAHHEGWRSRARRGGAKGLQTQESRFLQQEPNGRINQIQAAARLLLIPQASREQVHF